MVDGSKMVGGKTYSQSLVFKTAIRERDNHTCQLCGRYGKMVDHITPYAVSGETRPDGVRVLCVKCNLAIRRTRIDANPYDTLDKWYAHLREELDRLES